MRFWGVCRRGWIQSRFPNLWFYVDNVGCIAASPRLIPHKDYRSHPNLVYFASAAGDVLINLIP